LNKAHKGQIYITKETIEQCTWKDKNNNRKIKLYVLWCRNTHACSKRLG